MRTFPPVCWLLISRGEDLQSFGEHWSMCFCWNIMVMSYLIKFQSSAPLQKPFYNQNSVMQWLEFTTWKRKAGKVNRSVRRSVTATAASIQSGCSPEMCPAHPRARSDNRDGQMSWQHADVDYNGWRESDIIVTCATHKHQWGSKLVY